MTVQIDVNAGRMSLSFIRRSMYRNGTANVRFGSLADMAPSPHNVRFTPESGHLQCTSACPLCANSGLMRRNKRIVIRSPRRRA